MKQDIFAQRIAELQETIARLQQRQRDGWNYRKTWRRAHSVPAYRVRGHYAMLPVKGKR